MIKRLVSPARRWIIKQRRGRLIAKTAAFSQLFPPGAKVERIATGFRFAEGPVWFSEGRYLLFTDIPANTIYRLAADHTLSVFRHPSGHANGLTRDGAGRLLACEHSTRRLTRTEPDGTITVLATSFQGKKLNSPNDVVAKNDGSIYFTDPPYGIQAHLQEQPLQGVYRLATDGTLSVAADDFERPNGLAFSPDQSKLYIDDSSARRHIRVFHVQDDGALTNGRLFHDMRVAQPGAPDGMKIDSEGNVFCTGAGGVWVFDPSGQHLGTIITPEKPSNCAWGNDDWRTLFITAQTSLYKVRVATAGIAMP